MRVFMGVALGYVTTFSNQIISFDIVTMGGWVLVILPLFVAGILASLKVGELASMLVTGSAVTSSGITGAGMAVASGRQRRLPAAGAAGAARAARGGYESEQGERNRKDLRRDLGRGDPLQPALAGAVDGLDRALSSYW